MTTIEAPESQHLSGIARAVREWWPVPVFIVVSVLAQMLLFLRRYDVGGHAVGHLASVTAPFIAAAVIAILFGSTPQARNQFEVVLAALAWFVTTVLVMVGNVRVVDDLLQAGYGRTPTSAAPDIADHSLANASAW